MKTKATLLFAMYFTTAIAISLLQSCWPYKACINNIHFGAFDTKGFYPGEVANVTAAEEVLFVITDGPGITCSNFPVVSLVSQCYAMTKCADWQNDIDTTSITFSFNRDLQVNGDTLVSGTDIFKVPAIRQQITINGEAGCKGVWYYITFPKPLMQQLVTDTGVYTASLSCNTTDLKHFEKQCQVIFKE